MVNGRRTWFVGSLAAVLAAGAYIFWGPKAITKKKRDIIPGLHNPGNLCFLNAVLQALASCHTIVTWLAFVTRCHLPTRNLPNRESLLEALLCCLEVLNRQSSADSETEVFSPEHILSALRANRWVIACDEQDAHELFHVLTNTLKEECESFSNVTSLFEVSQLQVDALGPVGENGVIMKFCHHPPASVKNFVFPGQGLLASRLKCRECDFKNPVHVDTFDSISLAVPTPSLGPLNLYSCLQGFFSPELVHGVTCEGCSCAKKPAASATCANSSVTVKSIFIKQLTVGKLPKCLCFHIKRTIWLNNGISVKRFDHVIFPEHLTMDDFLYYNRKQTNSSTQDKHQQWLCLLGGTSKILNSKKVQKPVVSESNLMDSTVTNILEHDGLGNQSLIRNTEIQNGYPHHVYRLQAVIVHQGDTFSGHFLTYRRGPLKSPSNRRWFCTSDSTVREVPFSEVLQATAYMLFYERISSLLGV